MIRPEPGIQMYLFIGSDRSAEGNTHRRHTKVNLKFLVNNVEAEKLQHLKL